jgi:hypothetical protein
MGRLRKIALIGNAPSVHHAPWDDDSWEIWAHASSANYCQRVDRYFDLHPKKFWVKGKRWEPNYYGWLKRLETPIFMQRRYHEIPRSVAYPKARILAEFRRYMTSQAAWMIALAMTEGVTHLGFFGIHYASDAEHAAQRAGCEYWMGLAEGRGVHLVVPPGNPLLRTPDRLYGYESHDEGQLHASYRLSFVKPTVTGPAEGQTLIPLGTTDTPRLKDLGVPVNFGVWNTPGHWEPVKGEDDTWRHTASEAKAAATTTSRSATRPDANASSPGKRPRVKSTAGARGRQSGPASPRPTSTKTSASATPRRSATTRPPRRPAAKRGE